MSVFRNELHDWQKLPTAWVKPTEQEHARLQAFYASLNTRKKVRGSKPLRVPGAPTKQEIATKIVTDYPAATRAELLELIMRDCQMSKAGATTYLYNALKVVRK